MFMYYDNTGGGGGGVEGLNVHTCTVVEGIKPIESYVTFYLQRYYGWTEDALQIWLIISPNKGFVNITVLSSPQPRPPPGVRPLTMKPLTLQL